jgi:hypothetical protein
MKLSIEEYRKKELRTYNVFLRTLAYLRISNIKVIDKKAWNNNSDYFIKIRELNPYNPISYIIFILLMICKIIFNGLKCINKKEITDLFKYR